MAPTFGLKKKKGAKKLQNQFSNSRDMEEDGDVAKAEAANAEWDEDHLTRVMEKKDKTLSQEQGQNEDDEEEEEGTVLQGLKPEWTDRERVLVLCSRGALARTRHLMQDLCRLMPHTRTETKFDKSAPLAELNELAEMDNCSRCLYFESRKRQDVYLWMADVAHGGPSVKFLVHNMHTMAELNLSGNCLKGSRPVLSFDPRFEGDKAKPHLRLIKELLTNTFNTPNHHPRSQPFVDHVLNFSLTSDGNIWVRNYQIVTPESAELRSKIAASKEGAAAQEQAALLELEEIGPRMVLEVIRVFAGSFHGEVLYDNPHYVTPNARRRQLKLVKAAEQRHRVEQRDQQRVKEGMISGVRFQEPIDSVFDTTATIEGTTMDNSASSAAKGVGGGVGARGKKKDGGAMDEAERLDRLILRGGTAKKKRKLGRRSEGKDGGGERFDEAADEQMLDS